MALDRIIHEHSRLRILTYCAVNESSEVSFNELQDALGFSSGNLSVQLKKLNDVSYIKIKKTFVDNRPRTSVLITAKGRTALEKYLEEMEDIIRSFRYR